MNDAFCNIIGYSRDEILGGVVAWQKQTPPEYHGRVLRVLEMSARGEVSEPFELEYVKKDRTRVPVLVGGGPLPGAPPRVVVFFVDLSALNRGEEVRRANERRARFLADASRRLSESLDVEAILSTIGRLAVPALADWSQIETFGTDLTPQHRVLTHSDAEKAARANAAAERYVPERNPAHPFAHVIATGRSVLLSSIPDSLLVTIARDAEHLAWLHELNLQSVVVVPMFARGRAIGVLGLAMAESGRRFDEQDLALAEELARRAAMAVDNARLYAELREEARRKDEFLAMLAHELRNPLAPILTATTVLDRLGAPTPAAARLLSIIGRQTRHVARLVDDLLDVARLATGKVQLQRQRIDLRDVVRQSMAGLLPSGRGTGHDITMSLPADAVVVDADPLRLEQIVSNLLDNAVKYTPAGRAIRVSVRRENDTAVVRVEDEGVGIAHELLARLFEPFVQGEQSPARPQGGLGLGLALVRALVEQHGGSVIAHSEGVGRGSEFVICLPLAKPVESSRGDSAPGPAPKSLTILVVEDNADARDALRALLESDGHDVDTAEDAEHALTTLVTRPRDVVIIDIGLPHMDGYELARRLRTSPATSAARLVALTGYGQPQDRRLSQDAGFDAHLVKPVDEHVLARVLTEVTRFASR